MRRQFGTLLTDFERMGRSAADAYVADPPSVAVPEALVLPVAGANRAAGIARGTVIAIARTRRVVAGAAVIAIAGAVVIRARGDCATDDGAADQPRSEARAP